MTNRVVLVVLAAGQGERFGGLKQLAGVGPNGEALMDYSIHYAFAVGFEEVVIVVRAEIQRAVEDHVRRTLGERLPVAYAQQPSGPDTAGTAPAVLTARGIVRDRPFVVTNADDLYPKAVLAALHGWLGEAGSSHALVAFPLVETFLTGATTVSRALCDRAPDGTLARIVEASVERRDGSFVARPLDDSEPADVGGDQLVSMNAFGFRPSVWAFLEQAVQRSVDDVAPRSGEFPLPVLMAGLLDQLSIIVLPVAERCVGLTWPTDLPLLQEEVRRRIQTGELPSRLRQSRPWSPRPWSPRR